MLRRVLSRLLLAVLATCGLALAVGQLDLCPGWKVGEPALVEVVTAQGPLRVGTGMAELRPPLPIPIAGYAPPRHDADAVASPLRARALVLESDGVRFGLVTLDVLTVPAEVVEDVRAAVSTLALDGLWVAATHTHASFGGYDDALASQLVGLGRYRPAARLALVLGAEEALRAAARNTVPVQPSLGEAEIPHVTAPRTGRASDQRFTRISFRAGGQALAQLVVMAAHPTLMGRDRHSLHPDFPAALADAEQARGHGFTVVLQGAVGNAAAVVVEHDPAAVLGGYVGRVQAALDQVPLESLATPSLAFARAAVPLPRPHLGHSLPHPVRRPAESLLCQGTPSTAEASLLVLGPLRLLALPVEVTFDSTLALERVLGKGRTVSLVNGYAGYLEDGHTVTARAGESRRQYFPPELLAHFGKAATLLSDAVR